MKGGANRTIAVAGKFEARMAAEDVRKVLHDSETDQTPAPIPDAQILEPTLCVYCFFLQKAEARTRANAVSRARG